MGPVGDIRNAREQFPATARVVYLNTAAVGLASRGLADTYHGYVDEWAESGPDFVRGEAAGENARAAVARLIGADVTEIALIASVSAAAGLVASQFGPAAEGQNVVIGEREYSSNHFPWRFLATKGYDVRQVPFQHGGLAPDAIAQRVDGGSVLVAFSGVQTATGHRSDLRAISTIARDVGAIVFVDGSQLVGALPVADDLECIDALAEIGRAPVDLPEANRSTIVSVPLGDSDPAALLAQLKERGVVCAARDGNLRLSVHFYNHEDDIERLTGALSKL